MKIKHIVSLFLFGLIIMIVAIMFKIMHWPYGGVLVITASSLKVFALALGIWKVMTDDL